MLADLKSRGDLSPTTVRYALTVLRIALGRAVKSGKVVRNVAALVDAPAKAEHNIRPLSVEQVATLLDAVQDDRLAALYVSAIGLGLRQGELLALRWRDVDLDAGTVKVRHTLTLETRELAEPKTELARRTLRMPASVLEALRDHRRAQVAERLAAGSRWVDLDFVFTTRAGRPLMARNVLRAFQGHLRGGWTPPPALARPAARLRHPAPGGWRGTRRDLADARSREHHDDGQHLRPPDASNARPDRGPDGRRSDPSKASSRILIGVRSGVQAQNETPGGRPSGVISSWNAGEPGRT